VAYTHGTAGTYGRGCRCAECREAWRVYSVARRAVRAELLRDDPTLVAHGRASTYDNWGCRCDECRVAGSEVVRRRRVRRLARNE